MAGFFDSVRATTSVQPTRTDGGWDPAQYGSVGTATSAPATGGYTGGQVPGGVWGRPSSEATQRTHVYTQADYEQDQAYQAANGGAPLPPWRGGTTGASPAVQPTRMQVPPLQAPSGAPLSESDQLQQYRQAMAAQGMRVDETDSRVLTDPNFLNWAKTNQLPQQGQSLAGLGGGTGSAQQQYGFGSAIAPFTGQFNAPTADQALQTPGLQYALGRAQQAIERSAASKGTLLTGGTLRDLSENQIGMALQGYQQTYNNARGEFDLGRSIFESNQDRPYSKYLSLAQLGKPV